MAARGSSRCPRRGSRSARKRSTERASSTRGCAKASATPSSMSSRAGSKPCATSFRSATPTNARRAMTDHIQIAKSDGLLTLVIDRPAKKHALTDAMYKALADALESARDAAEVRVVLADDAQLVTPFVNLALVPEAASTLLLPARIGYVRAFAMFALGEPVTAHDAVAWGLANKAVPASELVATAEAFARRLAAQPVGALIATKQLLRDSAALLAQIDRENQHFFERLKTAEAREAFMAFAERRAPRFAR